MVRQGLVLIAFVVGGLVVSGCSQSADKDPKPVNVKDDPRIKISGEGGGKMNTGQGTDAIAK
ncbi:MAG: hypothetical protein RMJ56_11690 [Gemmataceae bacterium]|nr:hypothetical protein [Gemmata sp.]MDW8198254.1 hypothetical protein [Gemmataceae bacterium]